MNWVDIVIVVVLLLSVLGGVRNGLVKSVLGLAGLLLGIFLAGRYYARVGMWLPIGDAAVAGIIGYVIIFIAVVVAAALVGLLLRRIISMIMLGWADRLLGAVFGLISGGLFCAATLAVCVKFGIGSGSIQGSGIARFLLDLFPVVLVLLPGEFDVVREFFR